MFKDPSRYGIKDCYALIGFAVLLIAIPLLLSFAGIVLWEGFTAYGILLGTTIIGLTFYWIAERNSEAGAELGDYKALSLIGILALGATAFITFFLTMNFFWLITAALMVIGWEDIKEGSSFLKKRYSL